MASTTKNDAEPKTPTHQSPQDVSTQPEPPSGGRQSARSDDDEEDEEDEEEEEEPKLKYARVTSSLGNLYRNGDATSAFLAAGDKMIIGTHNGNIHVLSLPSFQSLKVYHAHSASVTAITISPFPPPPPNPKADAAALKAAAAQQNTPTKTTPTPAASPNSKTSRQRVIPATASNAIYIATSSIDGNVCVASLVDAKDVLSRNFGRPVQTVALSPAYKSDRTYLSGGLAGNLILTVGGKAGTTSTSSTTGGAAASASGWLGSIGIGPNTSKDTVLHSGEGSISTIKWSRSGKYVVWVNEHGIKIMRSHLHLGSEDLDSAWKRISHIDRPDGSSWEEMSAVWKGRAEWVDEDGLETDDNIAPETLPLMKTTSKGLKALPVPTKSKRRKIEKLLVGWGGTVWIINVYPEGTGVGKNAGERILGSAEIVNVLRTDCIISGLTLYTPSLLIVLAYVVPEADETPTAPNTTPKRGVHHRKNALSPELRIIDITSSEAEEVSTDSLTVSRFESLAATDYHLSILPSVREATPYEQQRGALEYVGGSLLTAGAYATSIFSSAASIRAGSGKSETGSDSAQRVSSTSSLNKIQAGVEQVQVVHTAAAGPGMKIYIHSPYDCILATKRDLADHLSWLLAQENFEEAWNLVNEHPEVAQNNDERLPDNGSPTRKTNLGVSSDDISTDDASNSTSIVPNLYSSSEKEKRRIGELWLQQLLDKHDWRASGQICGKVLNTSTRWDHWFWIFAKADKFDEITPHIPTVQLKPPLPTLVYEVILGHYVSHDRMRLKDLLDEWPTELFDVKSVTTTIQGKLKSGEVGKDTSEDGQKGRDWRILMEVLAKLLIADGRPREALRCFIQLKYPDEAMKLIRDYHLLDAVADDIPGLILLRVTPEQMKRTTPSELEKLTEEPIKLLTNEAVHGIVRSETVVEQLEEANRYLLLFFYLRNLWKGDTVDSNERAAEQIRQESRSVVENFGDTAVDLFAEYERPLLMQFLKNSQSYTFEKALAVCERRNYVDEQVFLLSKTGQTKRALYLIIDKLQDVTGAISFAKQQNDPDLWNDLLDYSMDKPRFVRGLLEEIGTAINPITLVKRIPDSLEVEGLKEGLCRMLKEYEIQHSICEGVAKVFRGEVGNGMDALRIKQKQGIKYEILPAKTRSVSHGETQKSPSKASSKGPTKIRAGHCVGCERHFVEQEKEPLVGFYCGHMFHLKCLLLYEDRPPDLPPPIYSDDDVGASGDNIRNRITYAQLVRNMIDEGCPVPAHHGESELA